MPAAPPSSSVRGGCCWLLQSDPSPERPPSWISMLLLWLLITRVRKRHALHAAALRRWANRLHVGDSRHLVMSPSEALAKLLTDDDHWFHGLVLQLGEATRGVCVQMVTRETNGCCAGRLLWIDVGIFSADCHSAAECLAGIAFACRKRSHGSQRPILSTSFCNGLRIHRSEWCQC